MYVASGLNSTVVEHRIDRSSFQPSKKVNPSHLTSQTSICFSRTFAGSPADKAGLYIDDEVIAMQDESIEKMTFEQVRKILKERNLRGTIKVTVRTYEGKISWWTTEQSHRQVSVVGDIVSRPRQRSNETTATEMGSQMDVWRLEEYLTTDWTVIDRHQRRWKHISIVTVSILFSLILFCVDIVDDSSQAHTTQHSRTPSPQKPMPSSTSMTKTTTTTQSPVYTFLPYTPPSSTTVNQPSASASLNIVAPKPFRSTNLDSSNSPDTVRIPRSIFVNVQLMSRRWPSREKNWWR